MDQDRNGIYLVIDGNNSRNGITDRLKAAVGLYYIAKTNGIPFRFIHTAGFDLRDYLVPNETDWTAELSDLSADPGKVRRISYYPPFGDAGIAFRRDMQYVCRDYIGKNYLEMTGVPDWQAVWRKLFLELFAPSGQVLRDLKNDPGEEHYAVVNARFINALGVFEDAGYNAPFPPETQEKIIEAVLRKAEACREDTEEPVILYSDSVRFLKEAEKRGFRICDTEGVGHIMNPGVSERVILKTFVNFFAMANADRIYSILNVEGIPENSLYKTQYPRYAAIVGGKPFIRI